MSYFHDRNPASPVQILAFVNLENVIYLGVGMIMGQNKANTMNCDKLLLIIFCFFPPGLINEKNKQLIDSQIIRTVKVAGLI